MPSLADIKARIAAVADDRIEIVFEAGYADEVTWVPLAMDTTAGPCVAVVAVPPVWSSPALLRAFSARATAALTGSCPICLTTGNITLDADGHGTHAFAHEPACPAGTDRMAELFTRDRTAHEGTDHG